MSYILDALKQKSAADNSSQNHGFITVGQHQSTLASELTSLIAQIIVAAAIGFASSYAINLIRNEISPPPQLVVESNNENLWPIIQSQVQQDYFDDPLLAIPSGIQPQAEYGAVEQDIVSDQSDGESNETETVEISDALKQQFAAAVRESENSFSSDAPEEAIVNQQMPHLSELPYDIQDRVPKMTFTSHMYASEKAERWIEVNGKRLQEQQWIASNVRLIAIRPQHVVLETNEYRYLLPALSEW